MKKLIIFFVILCSINFGYGYQESMEDRKIMGKSYNIIDDVFKKENGITKLNIVRNIISNKLETEKDERNIYILSGINNYIENMLPKPQENNPKLETDKIENKSDTNTSSKKIILNSLWNGIINKQSLPKLCFDKFDMIDKIAKEYNFPTELIIATWKIETNCNFQNPGNGKGPFQIMSYYYKPGKITDQQFKQSIVEFIKFSKNKWNRHDKKQLFKKGKLNITYDNYSLEDIRIHGVLYNSIAKKPATSPYVNGNLTSKNKYKKDGLIVNILKVLKEKI